MRHQLHLMASTRAWYLERHDFYVAQIQKRVLNNFTDANREAEDAAEAEYQRLMSLPATAETDIDLADLADIATEHGQNLYNLLEGMREQSLLSALAGCFHQWDKELRDFLDNELRYTMGKVRRQKIVWRGDFERIFGLLTNFGWKVSDQPFFPFLDAARLIVNVYKHGKGQSLSELHSKYPQYIHDPLPELLPEHRNELLDHQWVKISDAQFEQLATNGMRQFWLDFPELMYDPPPSQH